MNIKFTEKDIGLFYSFHMNPQVYADMHILMANLHVILKFRDMGIVTITDKNVFEITPLGNQFITKLTNTANDYLNTLNTNSKGT